MRMENSSINESGDWISTSVETTAQPFQVYTYYYMRQLFASMCVIVSIVGFVGNTMVITAVALSKKLRTVTNVFVVNLSVSDLLSCIFLPWEAVAALSEDGWPLPRAYWVCVATSAVTIVGACCSINNLALIAVNRWIGITKSIDTTRRIYTRRNIAGMMAFSWALPLCVSVIAPLNGFGELGYEPLYGTCSWVKANPFSIIQNISGFALHFPIQLTVIALCYRSIFRYVLKTSRRMAQHDTSSVSGEVSGADRTMRKKLWKRQVAVTKNLVYIVLAYIICLTPFAFSTVPLGYDWSIRMTPYAGAIMFCNSCINPIIYATSHPDFKEAFGYMSRCQFKAIPPNRAQSRQIRMQTSRNRA